MGLYGARVRRFVVWLRAHVGWLDDLHTWRVNRRMAREGWIVRRPTRAQRDQALRIARERGLLRADGTWVWDD